MVSLSGTGGREIGRGLERHRCGARRRCGRRFPAFARFALRLEHAPHPCTEALVARRAAGAAFGLEELGRGVVGDVIAADLVATATQERPVIELQQVLGAVVLAALREALVVLVHPVALLAK